MFDSLLLGLPSTSTLSNFLDWALHIEVALRHVIVFAFQNLLEAANGFSDRDLLPLVASEHLRHAKGLAKKTLNLACSEYSQLIFGRKLIHAENGNYVLQIFKPLQHFLHSTRHIIVLLTYDFGGERAGSR